ncbi:hypothetical protein LguiA_029827 [Lonicera macranthoides]
MAENSLKISKDEKQEKEGVGREGRGKIELPEDREVVVGDDKEGNGVSIRWKLDRRQSGCHYLFTLEFVAEYFFRFYMIGITGEEQQNHDPTASSLSLPSEVFQCSYLSIHRS